MDPRIKTILKTAVERLGLDPHICRHHLAILTSRLRTDSRLTGTRATAALVGCGRQGLVVAQGVQLLERWRIAHLHDLSLEVAQGFRSAAAPSATVHPTLDDLLTHAPQIDVLLVATTAASHVDVARRAIAAGIHSIFLEKPISTNLIDCDRLIEEAQRHSVRIAVDHTRRYLPGPRLIADLLSRGTLGPLRSLYFLHGRAGLSMMGSHLFDHARQLTGSEIARVRAELDDVRHTTSRGGDSEDFAGRAEFRMQDGTRGVLDLSGDLTFRHASIILVCEAGRLEIDERRNLFRLIGAGERVFEAEYCHQGSLPYGIARALLELQSSKPLSCSARDGRDALEAVIASHSSARSGGHWVELPLSGEERARSYAFA